TGVQTCALPISSRNDSRSHSGTSLGEARLSNPSEDVTSVRDCKPSVFVPVWAEQAAAIIKIRQGTTVRALSMRMHPLMCQVPDEAVTASWQYHSVGLGP